MRLKRKTKKYISTSFLKQCEPYLNKYFGISYGYFEQEIMKLKNYNTYNLKIGESPTLMAIEIEDDICFSHQIRSNEFRQLFKGHF